MTHMLRSLLLVALSVILVSPALRAFPLEAAGIDTARTSVWIHDLRLGADLVRANIDCPLVPASVTKAVTSASLLSIADENERFATPVVALGEISAGGVLDGDIVVRASGDPTIESAFLEGTRGFADSIASAALRAGIREVRGSVVIDESGFQDATTPPGWMDEDLLWPYGARLHGANYSDNRFQLRWPSRATVPEVPGLKFSAVQGRGRRAKVTRKDGSETFTVSGNTRRAFSDSYAMPRPSKAMHAAVTKALADAGITVKGGKTGKLEAEHPLYVHLSPPFGEILRSLMVRSDNLMAEGMLRALVPGGTRAEALAEQRKIWASEVLSPHGVSLVDGSGLSRSDRLTARFLGGVLRSMAASDASEVYAGLFPRAGIDGTLRNFLVETPLEGRVAMKTGSMRGVQSYAGYLLDDEGRPTHMMVFIANDFRCARAGLKNAIQDLLLKIFSVSLQNEN